MSKERHYCLQCDEECDCMSDPCITCSICDDQDSDEREIEMKQREIENRYRDCSS